MWNLWKWVNPTGWVLIRTYADEAIAIYEADLLAEQTDICLGLSRVYPDITFVYKVWNT